MVQARVEILAHRGWWERPEERNTLPALQRAFAAGLGVETDVRDFAGQPVISHDPPRERGLTLAELLREYAQAKSPGWLALNIKADGLQEMMGGLLREFAMTRYFLFDMAVPDAVLWHRAGLRFFTRQSEWEPQPALYDQAAGVWLDGFTREAWDADTIRGHLQRGKHVAVVSPEIHQRDHTAAWSALQQAAVGREGGRGDAGSGSDSPAVFLCTDRVADARRFFYAQD